MRKVVPQFAAELRWHRDEDGIEYHLLALPNGDTFLLTDNQMDVARKRAIVKLGDYNPLWDVVFECPVCRKSMVIDREAIGRELACVGCGQRVVVPVPAGEERPERIARGGVDMAAAGGDESALSVVVGNTQVAVMRGRELHQICGGE